MEKLANFPTSNSKPVARGDRVHGSKPTTSLRETELSLLKNHTRNKIVLGQGFWTEAVKFELFSL